MDFLIIRDHFLDYFFHEFDHDLLLDQINNPFALISLINISAINPHRDSFGMYLIRRGASASHVGFTTYNMAYALCLEAEYLIQKPSSVDPIENKGGYTRGITIEKNQILISTVIASLDDAKFVCKSLINKLQISLNLPS